MLYHWLRNRHALKRIAQPFSPRRTVDVWYGTHSLYVVQTMQTRVFMFPYPLPSLTHARAHAQALMHTCTRYLVLQIVMLPFGEEVREIKYFLLTAQPKFAF